MNFRPMTVSELQERMRSLPHLVDNDEPHSWHHRRYSLREQVLQGDMDNFMNWSTMQAAITSGPRWFSEEEWNSLPRKFQVAAQDSMLGNPEPLPFARNSTANYCTLAYHLYQWERETGRRIEDCERIVEFGGGFGGMPVVAIKLGFRGEWWSYDLPEVALIQEWYLTNLHIHGIRYCPVVDESFPSPPEHCDLLIACHSLSEVPPSLQESFLGAVNTDAYLFTYGPRYLYYQNLPAHFRDIALKMADFEWEFLNPFEHRNYAIGWKEREE